ncbi:MAG: hypothetical protein D6758_01000, partial [Gammaproteobacteria bacterium]
IRLNVEPLPEALILEPGQPVRVLAADDGEADITLRGTPLQLLSFLIQPDAAAPAHEGDTDMLPRLSGLFHLEQVDVQPLLARFTGETPAELLAPLINEAGQLLKRTGEQFWEDLREYILNESGLVPHPEALQALDRESRSLAERVDALEARVKALQDKTGASRS